MRQRGVWVYGYDLGGVRRSTDSGVLVCGSWPLWDFDVSLISLKFGCFWLGRDFRYTSTTSPQSRYWGFSATVLWKIAWFWGCNRTIYFPTRLQNVLAEILSRHWTNNLTGPCNSVAHHKGLLVFCHREWVITDLILTNEKQHQWILSYECTWTVFALLFLYHSVKLPGPHGTNSKAHKAIHSNDIYFTVSASAVKTKLLQDSIISCY